MDQQKRPGAPRRPTSRKDIYSHIYPTGNCVELFFILVSLRILFEDTHLSVLRAFRTVIRDRIQ
ncbi:unnamed protein product [Nesidiocoris tenuis]|uniref:Uncharacterized protein n=1 Tax=Nesidiocoris tenuis TaxID=355587 RepID=A0A6H5HSK5_9HEMI|nr:unnamed protein product [Nesidiocoris tenuis]